METRLSRRTMKSRWYARFPRAVPVGIFVLTMAITGVSVYAIERAERQRETAQLGQIAQSVASGLERRANASSAYLRSGAALFATQRVVEAPLFQTFIGQLHLNGTYAGSDGIGWATARIDPKLTARVRAGMPLEEHREAARPWRAKAPS